MPATVSQLLSQTTGEEGREKNMEVVFHRLLKADRNSAEFADLWSQLDTYLTAEITKQRSRDD